MNYFFFFQFTRSLELNYSFHPTLISNDKLTKAQISFSKKKKQKTKAQIKKDVKKLKVLDEMQNFINDFLFFFILLSSVMIQMNMEMGKDFKYK